MRKQSPQARQCTAYWLGIASQMLYTLLPGFVRNDVKKVVLNWVLLCIGQCPAEFRKLLGSYIPIGMRLKLW